jgi:hypothetical protein
MLSPLPTQLMPLVAAKPGVVRALGMNPDLLGHGLAHALLPTLLRMDSLSWPPVLMQNQSAIRGERRLKVVGCCPQNDCRIGWLRE